MFVELAARIHASRDFIDRVVQTFATKALLILISLLSGVIIARTLGPDGRGTYAVATAIGTIGAHFAALGMHASNTYLLAKDNALLRLLVGNSLAISVTTGGLLGVVLVSGSRLGLGKEIIQGQMLWLAVAAIPIYTALSLLQNLLLGLYETARFNATEIAENLAGLMLLVLLVMLGLETPFTVYGSSLLVSLGMVAVLSGWMVRKAGGIGLSVALLRSHAGFSARAYLSTLFFLLAARIDILLIAHFLDQAQAGLYAVATTLGEMLSMVAVVTGNILFPRLVRETGSESRWHIAKQTALAIGVLVGLFGLVSLPLAEWLVTLLYGEAFRHSASAYAYLVPGMICISVNSIMMNFYAAEGMPRIVIFAPLLAVLIKLVLGVTLIPAYGIDGAAISSSIAFSLVLLLTLSYLFFWHRRAAAAVSQG